MTHPPFCDDAQDCKPAILHHFLPYNGLNFQIPDKIQEFFEKSPISSTFQKISCNFAGFSPNGRSSNVKACTFTGISQTPVSIV